MMNMDWANYKTCSPERQKEIDQYKLGYSQAEKDPTSDDPNYMEGWKSGRACLMNTSGT